jgi:GNAT superfamily N-acetyltransferase
MRFMDIELARRVEMAEAHAARACAEALQQLHPELGVAIEKIAGGSAVFGGIGSPITQAIGVGLNGTPSEAELEQLEEFYCSRGAAVELELCPLVELSLYQLLSKRGYRLIEVSSVLVREISTADRFGTTSTEVSVRAAREDEGTLWSRTVAEGFAEEFPVTAEIVDLMQAFFRRGEACCFFAFAGGAAAGGGVVAAHEGVGGLFGASTLPALRRRGVQAALLAERLRWAQLQGCDLVASIAQPGSASQRNIERAGFCVAYTRTKLSRGKGN